MAKFNKGDIVTSKTKSFLLRKYKARGYDHYKILGRYYSILDLRSLLGKKYKLSQCQPDFFGDCSVCGIDIFIADERDMAPSKLPSEISRH